MKNKSAKAIKEIYSPEFQKRQKESIEFIQKLSFEKDFPGLKGKEHVILEFEPAKQESEYLESRYGGFHYNPLIKDGNTFKGKTMNIIPKESTGIVYPEEEIQKHCLDKQKVRDVLEKYIHPELKDINKTGWENTLEVIKKELGI